MSRIYFHSLDGHAEVSGAERAAFSRTCSAICWSVLEPYAEDYASQPSPLRQLLPPGHYVTTFKDRFNLWLRVGDDASIIFKGEARGVFPVILNTAYYMGSDPIKLAARLHGQCELHTWVSGPNRYWLSQIIREGRRFKFLRDDMGWESVLELLDKGCKTPVVTSYSVCDSFPNPYLAGIEDEEEAEIWYMQTIEEQWETAFWNGLYKQKSGLELKPDNWNDFYFADGLDANQLIAALYEKESL